MQGVTEPCYRDLVLAANASNQLGGAFTEFIRVVTRPSTHKVLSQQLGPMRFDAPVGLQLMGSHVESLASTAARAVEVGAPLLDLNFGCPAKGAVGGCAGSALLREPKKLEEIVARCVQAVAGAVPVTAKIRAGDENADSIEVLARAAENGGANLLTVHCRTRVEHYCREVDWTRIARAVEAVQIPVCGNGGVDHHVDLERMRRETGCDYVMVGRAALGNPWIFGEQQVGPAQAAQFLLDYEQILGERILNDPKARAGRLKQLIRHWTAGNLVQGEHREWLAMRDPEQLFERLRGIAQGA
jgi:tRNA-dihydrouridine synthase